ncbi:DUF5133 domain-containing protein [Streptomyces sp. NBC_01558]|uniref:DUF5133 domain-containing protein n=1 Tax=Streptomyces sp. NBC_01558 TaxID=2975878 RepID=UPI002DDC79DC|nr:DUF5133 domain-containing protein [Streptomyces sp. NBC_01558]WSD75024.1 DUF5133 domain-containing protein [Streptomyces sp. NBC_01558]
MLMPLPSTLRQLLTEYETLRAATGTTPPSQRLRDLDYTLCVSTGTREITQALETARSYLATCTDTPTVADGKRDPEPRANDASREAPALTATVFQHEIGALRRTGGALPRPAELPGANAGQGGGQ